MREQIGQLLFIGLSGLELTSQEAEFISQNNIGGVTLFARNIESPQQLHKLCSDLQACTHKSHERLPLLIAIDQEGGRVQRLKPPFTQWPAMAKLGALDSTSLAFKVALAIGTELKAVGINVDFAPCVDVLTNSSNQVIGDRALGTDAEQVAKMGSALVRGFIKSGVIPCAKHFPGHGNTLLDSHEDLPEEDQVSLDQLMERELSPFKKVFRARLDMVMTAHIRFKQIDPEWPVTLSSKFLKEILRNELRYRNLVISDDLDMKALSTHFDKNKIPVMAFNAGCDLLLYCNDPESPPLALEAMMKAAEDGTIDKARVQESYQRIVQLKRENLTAMGPFDQASRVIGHPDHLRLAKAIEEGQIPDDLS